jgi:hypothetical protein
MSEMTLMKSQLNRLVGVAYYDLACDFVEVSASVHMNVKRLRELHPKVFNTVKQDIERGYRTTTDEMIIRIEDTLLDWLYSSWRMSYIGKGVMQVHLSNYTKLTELREAIKGLMELMENPCTVRWNEGGFKIAAPITYKQVYDKRKDKERSVPQIVHSFREIRPLVLKELETERQLRKEALQKWIEEPRLNLYFPK